MELTRCTKILYLGSSSIIQSRQDLEKQRQGDDQGKEIDLFQRTLYGLCYLIAMLQTKICNGVSHDPSGDQYAKVKNRILSPQGVEIGILMPYLHPRFSFVVC